MALTQFELRNAKPAEKGIYAPGAKPCQMHGCSWREFEAMRRQQATQGADVAPISSHPKIVSPVVSESVAETTKSTHP